MEKILIDKFIVPEESRQAFLDASRTIQAILKTLPGFVEGFVYEKTEGDGRQNILTTAVWASEEAYVNARKAVAAALQTRGLNPQEIMKGLDIEVERGVYERTPY